MKMKRFLAKLLTLVFLFACFFTSVYAQEKFSIRVEVEVSASEPLVSDIKSYINRGLRSLGDVVVVDTKPDLILEIVAVEEVTNDNRKIGLAMSVIVRSPFDPEMLKITTALAFGIKNPQASLDLQKAIEKQVQGYDMVVVHWIRTGGPNSVKEMCERILTNFDAEILEIDRKIFQEASEKAKKKP